MRFNVGIDLMGGEMPPVEIFDTVLQLSKDIGLEHKFFCIATYSALDRINKSQIPQNFELIAADHSIEMDESPLLAVRRKKNSSISKGINLLKGAEIDAFVSTGNTGALVASASMILPMLPGIERPALLTHLPTKDGFFAVLDVGANLNCSAEHLIHFAQMGAIFQNSVQGIKIPKVGLLNIGIEAQKGTKGIREAYERLKETSQSKVKINFLGNVEGHEAFEGKVDVLVTDGFTGNVFLKTSEGVSMYILSSLERMLGKTDPQISDVLNKLYAHVSYAEYPGAVLCGVDGLVIKCHGYSCSKAIANGIRGAFNFIQKGLMDAFKTNLK